MCKSKTAVDAAEPRSSTPRRSRSSRTPRSSSSKPLATSQIPTSSSFPDPTTSSLTTVDNTSGYDLDDSIVTASLSSRASLSNLRESLPENPHIYDFAEVRSATNNFLAKRHSSSSSSPCWRCTLRGRDVVIFQRKFRRSMETSELREKLSVICRSHHTSVIKLLGASISGDHIYLVYDFVHGANLSDCLRNPKNPNFTPLSTWTSRMQIATDLAHGLDYIHNNAGLNINLIHKHVKSSGVIVTEPSFNAKICHFGTTELCGETVIQRKEGKFAGRGESGEISPELNRWGGGISQFEGVRGYMSPEFQVTGVVTQKSDVFAFGIVILELLSGEEPVKFKFDRARGDYRKISLVDTARKAVEGDGNGGGKGEDWRLRRWVDRRLKDSFPVEVVEKMTRLALECVHVDPDERPDMGLVAGKISKLFLETKVWSDRVKVPSDFSVSLAPR